MFSESIVPVCVVCGVIVIVVVVLFIFRKKLPCFKKIEDDYDDLERPKRGVTDKPDNEF